MLAPILACTDIDTAILYYKEKLGFTHAWSMADDQGKTNFACVSLGTAEILLGVTEGYVNDEDLTKRGTGVEIYFALPHEMDIESFYNYACMSEALIVRALEQQTWGVRSFIVKDADGYQLHFAQTPRDTSVATPA